MLNTFAMKKTLLTLVTTLLASSVSMAAGFCDDITVIDKMAHLNAEEFEQFKSSNQAIDRIVVSKDRKTLYTVKGDVVLKSYQVAFGGNPFGHKQFEGDQKTPEGIYTIDYKNPKSAFYLGLHVSYPNRQDESFAQSKGRSAGGNIMVHGFPSKDKTKRVIVENVHPMYNWTDGCMAVTDQEIYEIYNMVRVGTTIEICKHQEQ